MFVPRLNSLIVSGPFFFHCSRFVSSRGFRLVPSVGAFEPAARWFLDPSKELTCESAEWQTWAMNRPKEATLRGLLTGYFRATWHPVPRLASGGGTAPGRRNGAGRAEEWPSFMFFQDRIDVGREIRGAPQRSVTKWFGPKHRKLRVRT